MWSTLQLFIVYTQIGNTSGNVIITSAVSNVASVNGLLIVLAALDGTNGTTEFSNVVTTQEHQLPQRPPVLLQKILPLLVRTTTNQIDI
jgi:hypothetical protein